VRHHPQFNEVCSLAWLCATFLQADPCHRVVSILPQVLAQGYSVGRVEEMQRASSRAGAGGGGGGGGSKLLVRQLVRIYTPGTAVEGLLLDDQVGACYVCLHLLGFSGEGVL